MTDKLEIIEALHTPTNTLCFLVIENDGSQYPEHGAFRTKAAAQRYIAKATGAA